MSDRIVNLYRWIDTLQKKPLFKVCASVVILALTIVSAVVLLGQDAASRPTFFERDSMVYASSLLVLAWSMLVIWLGLTLTYGLIVIGTALLAALCMFATGSRGLALAIAGVGTLSFTFLLLMQAVLFLFRYPSDILAVAHTVVKESIRLRISVFFIVLLLLLLPTIPLWVESEQALRYRIQAFISFSTTTTFYLAALMTIFLACGTVAFEIRDRQIWQLLTKPLSRLHYLIGKWVGVAAVNLVILIVAGLSIFMFVQYLSTLPPDNQRDADAVRNEVLVARKGTLPDYQPLDREVLRNRITQIIKNDPELQRVIDRGERDEARERRRIGREILKAYSFEERSIPAASGKKYIFSGLSEARRMGSDMRLRYRIHYGGDDTHEKRPIVIFIYKNGNPYIPPPGVSFRNPIIANYVPTMSHFANIPVDAIGDFEEHDGTLELQIFNGVINMQGELLPGPNTDLALNFDAKDLEVLYPVSGFEANYFRAMIVMWVKLSFMAMLGIAAATVLSFPVACLTAFTVFLAAVIGPYLAVSVEQFAIGHWWEIHRIIIWLIARGLVFLFQPFAEIKPSQSLVDGRLIPWFQVVMAILKLGVVWTGLTLGFGFLAFRDKELATYSGHG